MQQHCGQRARSCGASRKGFRRYRCVVCGQTWTSAERIGTKPTPVLGPVHPGCTNPSRSAGKMPDGRIRWRCPDCGKRWVESLYPKLPGTAAQRYFQRNRQQIYEAHKRWRERNHERWIALVSRAVKRWRERERLKGGGSAPN